MQAFSFSFSFTATCITTKDPDGFCHLVGFADKEHGTNHYLLLQRSFAEDEDDQDEELGMDTYHVEWCGQQNACYGGIARLVLGRDGAQITFKREAVHDMGGLEHLSIAFDLSADEYTELKAALAEIFAGEGCLEMADGLAPGAESAA
ncbi:Uncharacterised protein [Delftia tsuruhatensis]|uniref:Imm10 family immunity protein n=1 Tax=Delftia tsuruhatensis TaxID=180282 RepID=UPI001E6FB4D9|nr:Imm10 family immunity protein [Delftia tsuruhatensis]CAB5724091.1 Uncharacterised protein [Delftia tsuruhatensis]CAC9688148.1 Uncharacterised protein [Delftia tsuruhatensis]